MNTFLKQLFYLYGVNWSLHSTPLFLQTLLSCVAFRNGLRELLFSGFFRLLLCFEDPPFLVCIPSKDAEDT